MTYADWILIVWYFASLGFVLWLFFIRPVQPPWTGYHLKALHGLLLNFCQDKLVLMKIGPVIKQHSILTPTSAAYDSQTNHIYIDTRQVRSKKALVECFLHEICHANQYHQGRFRLGTSGNYWVRPIEQEARAFSKAWSKVALKIYKRFEKEKVS